MRTVIGLMLLVSTSCSSKEPAYDLAYASEWNFSVEGPVGGFLLVVNTSNRALDLTSFQVTSVTDDHSTAKVQVEAKPVSGTLPPRNVAGFVTPVSEAVLVGGGTVPEQRVDTRTDFLSIAISDAPPGVYDIRATVEVKLDGITTRLPLVIHHREGPTIYVDPVAGRRINVQR